MKRIMFSLLAFTILFASCCDDDSGQSDCTKNLQDGLTSDKTCSTSPSTDPSEIFKIVEESPAFPGCEDILNQAEKKKCSEKKMLEFIYDNLNYPQEAIDKMLEGQVVLSFVVETDGCVSGIKLEKDIGCCCGEESLRIVEMMPDWEPGKQRGTPVRVQFNLPIIFEL